MSEPLPATWVERIFARLHGFFGSRFASLWDGQDPAALKAIWAQALGSFGHEEGAGAIAAALQDCLELKHPPSLPEFRSMVKARYTPPKASAPARLEGPPVSEAQAEEARAKVADLANSMRAVDREWPNRILARHARGEFVSMAVLQMAKTAKERLRV